jgi:peflin
LGSALVNGDFTSFDPATVKMMMNMFSKDHGGSIGYEEFVSLWAFLAAWRQLFERFDEDGSGRINKEEFGKALVAFGYHLTPSFVNLLFSTFGKRVGGRGGRAGSLGTSAGIATWNARGEETAMSFDLFVRACVQLKRMTDVFKGYDGDRDGYVTLSFEEFLSGTYLIYSCFLDSLIFLSGEARLTEC